jgi:hypothetical protein
MARKATVACICCLGLSPRAARERDRLCSHCFERPGESFFVGSNRRLHSCARPVDPAKAKAAEDKAAGSVWDRVRGMLGGGR